MSTSRPEVSRHLSDDIVREIVSQLPAKDLVRTRALDRGLKDYIDKSAPIQFNILKDILGISDIESTEQGNDVQQYETLKHMEEAQATLAYGLTPSRRLQWSVPDWPAFVPGLLATAGKYFYSSDWDARVQRATQIKRFSLEKKADCSKPDVFEMSHPFSSWAVDVAEEILVVFWTSTQSPWESPRSISHISILDLWTMKPLTPKHSAIMLAITPGAQYHHRLSLRGDLIATTYLKGTFPERSDTGEVLIYNWKTGARYSINLPVGSQIKSAEILSSCAILVAASTELSKYMQVRLYAISPALQGDGLKHVATYDMPRLHQYLWVSDIILRSSPISMACSVDEGTGKEKNKEAEEEEVEGVVRMEVDGEDVKLEQRKRTRPTTKQTRLQDGNGIVHMTMKLAGFLMWEDGTIGREWVGTLTGCMLIPTLHNEAKAYLDSRKAGVPVPERPIFRPWETWAGSNFHWMPSHYRPTQQSLCGYRILVPLTQRQSMRADGTTQSRMVNLVMYDFNPKTVNKYLSERAREIDVEVPISKTTDTRVKESMSPVESEDMIFAQGQDTNGGLQCLTVKQLRNCTVDACAGFIDHDKIVLQSVVDTGPEPHQRHLDIQVLLVEHKRLAVLSQ